MAKTDFESVCACVEREKLLERHCCKPKRKRILELNTSSVVIAAAHTFQETETEQDSCLLIYRHALKENSCACFYSPAYIIGVFANGLRVCRICIEPLRVMRLCTHTHNHTHTTHNIFKNIYIYMQLSMCEALA